MTIESYISFAHELADASAMIIRRYFRSLSSIETKADESPVTIADKEAERAMRKMIEARFPEHGILGEEEGSTNPNAEYVWVIDPIDGTKNFITGQPIFGTLIALLGNGKSILGLINQPITNERWIATTDSKTMLNDMRCCVRTVAELSDAILSTTSPYLFAGDKLKSFNLLKNNVKYSVYGSDCYAYAMLATGQLDLVVESGLKPHDVMALIPIIENAGGTITNWQGQAIELKSDKTEIDVIATSNISLHNQAIKLLNKNEKPS